MDRLIVENQGETPVRTLGIYSHLEEPDYGDLPPIIQVGNGLHEFHDLEALWQVGGLPKALNEVGKTSLLPCQGNFVFFDPLNQ